MEYRGIQFQVLQTANPTGWKWIIELGGKRLTTGRSYSRLEAIADAQRVIDKATAKTLLLDKKTPRYEARSGRGITPDERNPRIIKPTPALTIHTGPL